MDNTNIEELGKMMAGYLTEKQGSHVIHNEYGFLVYEVKGESLHINNAYVKPKYRRSGKSGILMSQLIDVEAKKHNAKIVTCSCDHAQINPELSTQSILGYRHKVGYRFKIIPSNMLVDYYMELS